jgi:hypothetical protein
MAWHEVSNNKQPEQPYVRSQNSSSLTQRSIRSMMMNGAVDAKCGLHTTHRALTDLKLHAMPGFIMLVPTMTSRSTKHLACYSTLLSKTVDGALHRNLPFHP